MSNVSAVVRPVETEAVSRGLKPGSLTTLMSRLKSGSISEATAETKVEATAEGAFARMHGWSGAGRCAGPSALDVVGASCLGLRPRLVYGGPLALAEPVV